MSEPNRRDVTPLLIEDLKERTRVGTRKYGEPLRTFNGRSALQDAYEKALDLAQYLKQKLMEEEDLHRYANASRRLLKDLGGDDGPRLGSIMDRIDPARRKRIIDILEEEDAKNPTGA